MRKLRCCTSSNAASFWRDAGDAAIIRRGEERVNKEVGVLVVSGWWRGKFR